MSTVLAIQVKDKEAVIIRARALSDAPIEILGRRTISFHDSRLQPPIDSDSDIPANNLSAQSEIPPSIDLQENSSSNGNAHPEKDGESPVFNQDTSSNLGDFDEAIALLSSNHIVYNTLELPFSDQRKIDQVAPIQIQDALPFEIEDFLIDSAVVGPGQDTQHRVVSSLAPKTEVLRSLESLQEIGLDPRYITTHASALGALACILLPDTDGLYAILEVDGAIAALAVLRDGKPYLLRNFAVPEGTLAIVLTDIACSLVQAEQETKLKLRTVHVISSPESFEAIQKTLGPTAKPVDFRRLVINQSSEDLKLSEFTWSLGLISAEILRSKKSDYPIVNFRQGQYAYKRLWQEFWAALSGQLFFVLTAITLTFGYYGSLIYSNHRTLSEAESAIARMLQENFPGESIPYRLEESYLSGKVNDLEEQLRKMGSLSTLSPLQSMKELALAITPNLDVAIEALEIAASRITMRGTVANNETFSNLSTALKSRSDRFCNVQPDSRGRMSSGRVGFTAEISLCE